MNILLNKPFETTPEDLYPIVQKLINQLLRRWDLFWADELQLKVIPDVQIKTGKLDDGKVWMTNSEIPAERPENLLIEFYGFKIGSIQVVQVTRYPSRSTVLIKFRVTVKDYLNYSPIPIEENSKEYDDFLNRNGGYSQALYIMNYLTNGIIHFLTPSDQVGGTNQSGNKQKLIFKRKGELWHLEFNRDEKDLVDYKGMHYIHALLKRPNIEIPSIELYRLGNAKSPDNIFFPAGKKLITGRKISPEIDEGLAISGIDDHYSNLDLSSKEQYKNRIIEVDSKLEILKDAGGDSAEISELENEREWIQNALSGEHRNIVISESEKSRQTITQAIKRAYKKMMESPHEMTGLVRYLRSTINGGKFFIYQHDENIELEL